MAGSSATVIRAGSSVDRPARGEHIAQRHIVQTQPTPMSPREAITGIGGVFFKARDPKALAAWYREQLGVPVFPNSTYGTLKVGDDGRDATGTPLKTAWSTFPLTTEYFGEGPS